jgi:hypothetical protein
MQPGHRKAPSHQSSSDLRERGFQGPETHPIRHKVMLRIRNASPSICICEVLNSATYHLVSYGSYDRICLLIPRIVDRQEGVGLHCRVCRGIVHLPMRCSNLAQVEGRPWLNLEDRWIQRVLVMLAVQRQGWGVLCAYVSCALPVS